MAALKKNAGAGKLEAMMALLMISILAAALLERLLLYQEIAEKTAMETTVINLRSALRLQVAELRMQNRTQELIRLVETNPIEWLGAPPPNYAGERVNPSASAIPPGNWCFDRSRRQLIYRPQRTRLLKVSGEEEKLIRYQVTATIRKDKDGTPTGAEGLAFSLMSQYDWSVD